MGKRHKCDKCPREFTQIYNLRLHIKDVHENSEKVTCDLCDHQEFSHTLNLRRHIEKVHEGKNRPEKPKEATHFCSKCEKKFKYKISLLRHFAQVHECKIVSRYGKQYKYPYKQEDHKGDYKCEKCDKAFIWKATYNSHV